ncbi:hypothetical protein VKT23_007547 [Stygiomarasmius scandens]|uniref:Protein kinase domain-containing protein n=1 Tax=Marasmiellus scandens TaxID=2682957 RepID=A0ABR1JL47_9AGAR
MAASESISTTMLEYPRNRHRTDAKRRLTSNTTILVADDSNESSNQSRTSLGSFGGHFLLDKLRESITLTCDPLSTHRVSNHERQLSKGDQETHWKLVACISDWCQERIGDTEFVHAAFRHLSVASHLLEDFTTILETKSRTKLIFCYSQTNEISSAILSKLHQAVIIPLSPDAKEAASRPSNTDELRQMITLAERERAGDVIFHGLRPLWVPCVMELLQMELDNPSLDSNHHKKCLKYLRVLAQRFQVLPPSLFVKRLEREGTHAIRGGGYADIWRGSANGQAACLKVLRMFMYDDDGAQAKIIAAFCHEALIWRQLHHPNVLPFLGVNVDLFRPGFCLVSPWMSNGNIISFLKSHPEHDRIRCINQIAEGMNYLHSLNPPIVHGDIKGVNVLVSDNHQCCLGDFGLALAAESQSIAGSTGTIRGSLRWLAPELIDPRMFPLASEADITCRDIYAFACTAFEILSGEVPFSHHTSDAAVILAILKGERPARPNKVWCIDYIWNLIVQCWAQDSSARPRSSRIVNYLNSPITRLDVDTDSEEIRSPTTLPTHRISNLPSTQPSQDSCSTTVSWDIDTCRRLTRDYLSFLKAFLPTQAEERHQSMDSEAQRLVERCLLPLLDDPEYQRRLKSSLNHLTCRRPSVPLEGSDEVLFAA